MPDETTALLAPQAEPAENEHTAGTGIGRILSLLPVIIVMSLHHGFQNIVPLLFSPDLTSSIRHRSAAVVFTSALVSTPFWTALGDRYGRRFVLLLGLVGAVFPNVCLIWIHRLNLDPGFYLFGILIEGFLGGFTTFRAVTYAYAADSVPAYLRLAIFGIIQGVMSLSFIAVDYYGFDVLHLGTLQEMVSFAWIFSFALPITCLYLLVCIPESLRRQHDQIPSTASATEPRMSYLLGLALCFSSFIQSTEDFHGRQRWWGPYGSQYGDVVLKCLRYFVVIPALALLRVRLSSVSSLQWNLRLAFVSPASIVGVQTACVILIGLLFLLEFIVPSECGPFSGGLCIWFGLMLIVGTIGLIILPGLTNIAGPALLSLATGISEENDMQFEWGLMFGKLSILQSFSEAIFVARDDQPLGGPDERWNPILTSILLYFLHILTAGTVWKFARGSSPPDSPWWRPW